MIGLNGGLIGKYRSPSVNTGIWTPEEKRLSMSDPNWDDVALLLRMDGANASTTFTDSSKNAISVTANGNAQISTGQSVAGGASALFDGNNDYLTLSNSALSLGTGDFTIEMFVYRTGDTVGGNTTTANLFDFRTVEQPSTAISLSVAGSAAAQPSTFVYFVNGSNRVVSTAAATLNTWVHFALVRSAGLTRMYVAGQAQSATYADSGNYTQTALTIAGRFAAVSGDFRSFNGYIDQLRITKRARYAGNFTPPTAALPGA